MPKLIRNCIFAFKCEQKWENMKPTKVQGIKFCLDCQKEVFFCTTDEQVREAITLNRCISIEYIEPKNNRTVQLSGSPIRNPSEKDDIPF